MGTPVSYNGYQLHWPSNGSNHCYSFQPVGPLTHWGRVTHVCVGTNTNIGPANGLSPGRRQAIIWTNAGILLIGPLGTNFGEILIGVQTFSFKKMHLKMSSAKWRPFCPGLNGLSVLWSMGCRSLNAMLYTRFNEVERGYTGFTLFVRLYRIVSAQYLQQYSLDPFHIYTSYQATSVGVSCVKLVKIKKLKISADYLNL